MTTYRVFRRRPWKPNDKYPQGWEPDGAAKKHPVASGLTEDEAREMCRKANAGIDRSKHGQTYHEFEQE